MRDLELIAAIKESAPDDLAAILNAAAERHPKLYQSLVKNPQASTLHTPELLQAPLPTTSAARFPLEVFPLALQRFVTEGSDAICCPADFLAVPLLSLLGAAIGTSREIELKAGWREGPRLYTAVVSDAGSIKSPSLSLVARDFRRRQRELEQEHEKQRAQYEEDEAAFEEAVNARRRGGTEPDPPKPVEPIMTQVMTTDSTAEGLSILLKNNPRGIVFLQDELTAWVLGMNQFKGGKGSDRQAWLSYWNGSLVIINRKGQREPLIVNHPFVSVVGCMVPDSLRDLADEHGKEDGFIHRILFSYPEPRPIHWTDGEVSQEVSQEVTRIFDGLWALEPAWNEDNQRAPLCVPLSAPAKLEWVGWFEGHCREVEHPDFPDRLRGPWAKLRGYCARLALIIHLCRAVCGETTAETIDAGSVERASALVDYFKSHAKRVYGRLHCTPQDQSMIQAMAWIRRHGGEASAREILQGKVSGVGTADEVRGLLAKLESRGWGETIELARGKVIFRCSQVTDEP